MKYCLHILLLNLLLLSTGLAQEDKATKVFTASINDSTDVDVYLRYDNNREPEAYYCHVNTAVCEEGLCKLMVINVYWDLLGNFLRYALPDGESLTKLDHQEFTAEDHEKLYKILSDKGSILRDYPADDLIERQILTTKTTDVKVDAVTSATRADIKDAVVSGAAYSTYVLWHIVNGPIASEIAQHSKPFLTKERVDKMFYSENFYYQYYALNSIGPEDSEAYLRDIIHLVKHGVSYIPYFAIEKLPASAWTTDASQRSLLEYFKIADFELQNFILDRQLLARIAAIPGPLDGATVYEVGPGPGGLTRALLDAGASVVAVERELGHGQGLDLVLAEFGLDRVVDLLGLGLALGRILVAGVLLDSGLACGLACGRQPVVVGRLTIFARHGLACGILGGQARPR